MLYNYNEVKTIKYYIVCVCACVRARVLVGILAQITLNEFRIHVAPCCVRLWNVFLIIISINIYRRKFIIFMLKI
jgi:hypothetical protein